MVKILHRLTNWVKPRLKSERGSASIEFLGMVPYVFLMMVMVWQMIVGAFAYITVQSAANESAKVYATTSNVTEAVNASYKIIDSLKYVTVQQNHIQELGNRHFRSVVEIELSLVFLPNQFLGMTMPKIPIGLSVDGRKI